VNTRKAILLAVTVSVLIAGSVFAANTVRRHQGTHSFDRVNGIVVSIGGTDITATAAEVNTVDVTAGTATGSKAMVLSSAKTIATVTRITGGGFYDDSPTAKTASGDISTAELGAYQLFKVDTTAGAVDLDFSDSALGAALVGQEWKFLVTVGGTNALTITAGDAGVTTFATVQAGAGASCEDAGDFFIVVPYTTTAAKAWSFCTD